MNAKLKKCMITCFLVGMTCRGGIPEAPIVIYGVVRQDIGGASVRRTQGEVSVTIVPPYGEPITVAAELSNINDQFSFALQFPCEAVVNPQMNVSSNALVLTPMTLSYSCGSSAIDGVSAQVVGPGELVLSHIDRGSFQRLDLQLNVLPQDSDGDGISDEWELAHFYGVADPGRDQDGDGVTNLEEYLAGTDPWDAGSFLAFVEVQQSANGFTVRWDSEADRYYRIERSESLLEGFVPIAAGIQGMPPVNEFRDTSVPENQNAFYRIVVE